MNNYKHIHIKDVFRTHSKIPDGTFCQNKSTILSQLFSQRHLSQTPDQVLSWPLHIWWNFRIHSNILGETSHKNNPRAHDVINIHRKFHTRRLSMH